VGAQGGAGGAPPPPHRRGPYPQLPQAGGAEGNQKGKIEKGSGRIAVKG